MSIVEKIKISSIEENLKLSNAFVYHFAYDEGQVCAIPGGMDGHAIISSNVTTALNNSLQKKNYQKQTNDVEIAVTAVSPCVHPDASVICGDIEDSLGQADYFINPMRVVGVLSESTATYNRGEKFRKYRFLPGVFVGRASIPMVDGFFREESGSWRLDEAEGSELMVQWSSLNLEVGDINRGVVFPNKNPKPKNRDSRQANHSCSLFWS
ncbi:MAG: Uma2 family endonuclease [Bacteroidota bacterium]